MFSNYKIKQCVIIFIYSTGQGLVWSYRDVRRR